MIFHQNPLRKVLSQQVKARVGQETANRPFFFIFVLSTGIIFGFNFVSDDGRLYNMWDIYH